MATRRRTSQRNRASASVIDLTCDLDSDSETEVLIVGETAASAPAPVPSRTPSPLDIVGMVVNQNPATVPLPEPQPALATTDYPRNSTESQLETGISDLAIDVSLLQSHLREQSTNARGLRPSLERRLRELRQMHSGLSARVSQLTASRRLRFEALVRPLGAELDEVRRLVVAANQQAASAGAAWQQRDGGGPMRRPRPISLPDDPPLPSPPPLPPPPLLPLLPDLPPDSPPQASPALAAAAPARADRQPSPPSAGASSDLHCPVCWESVSNLKEQRCGFLVTRCGHWFCNPCLKSACRVRRECPICRSKLSSRPPFRPLYL